MSRSRQLPLRFPERLPTFEDMTISACNRGAIAAVRRTAHWPYHVFCLIGPPRSGLTSIAKAWAEQFKGIYLDAAINTDLSALTTGSLPQYIAIDNAEHLGKSEQFLNLVSAIGRTKGRLLLTSETAPSQWGSQSPDLASRLKSAPLGALAAPDEDMMRARLRVSARHAFMELPRAVEDYLVTRLGLSYTAIEEMVDQLAGAVSGRELTVPLAREILEQELGQGSLLDSGE